LSSIGSKIKNVLKPKPKPSSSSSSGSSSYPKQQFGSSSGGSHSGSSSYPKQQYGSSSGGSHSSGSSYPKQQYGSNIGSHSSGSSYPQQQYGSNTGIHSSNSGISGFSGSSSHVPTKKPKSKLKKRLTQVALVGAGVYAGYKLNKLKNKFSERLKNFGHGSHSSSHVSISVSNSRPRSRPSYDFDDWNDWREADGMLCRNNDDCQWIDPNLNCEDYELDFSPAAGWFGGDTVSIRGECTCRPGTIWNRQELSCYQPIRSRYEPGTASSISSFNIPMMIALVYAAFFIY